MRIAILKIGAAITFSTNNESAANADILYLLRTLKGSGHDYTICTKITRNTKIPPTLAKKDITTIKDFNDFDCVLLFNGRVNFFGGKEDTSILNTYRALHNTHKPIFYVNTDGAIRLESIWYYVKTKPWAHKYSSEEFELNGENITYITQGCDLPRIKSEISKRHYQDHTARSTVIPRHIIYYPFEKTILSSWSDNIKHSVPEIPLEDRPFDLGYGGYSRNSYREKLITKYYNQPELRVLLFGNLKNIYAPSAKREPAVPFQNVVTNMERCKATVIIGDEFYENNFHTLRMYEALIAGCIVFIDSKFDSEAIFYDYTDISQDEAFYFMVSNGEEVQRRLKDTKYTYSVYNRAREVILESYSQDYMKGLFNSILGRIC